MTLQNLKLTTPQEHYIEEHFEKRNPNGRFVADEPIFEEIKYRLFDRDKNIAQIYTLKELMSKTFRRAKFEFRGRFTGLKDKNGVEIYEGDVLFHPLQGRRKVFYPFSETVASYGLRDIDNGFGSTLQDSHAVWEVIGNIYDNPELVVK